MRIKQTEKTIKIDISHKHYLEPSFKKASQMADDSDDLLQKNHGPTLVSLRNIYTRTF